MGIEKTKDGIRKFRDKKRFSTQTALAEILKISPQNVSMWEAGKGFPSFQIAEKLFELGITVEELFGIEYNEIHNLSVQSSPISSNDLIQMQQKIQQMENRLAKLENGKN